MTELVHRRGASKLGMRNTNFKRLSPIHLHSIFLLLALPVSTNGFSNDAFECYVAAYSNTSDPPVLISPSLRIGLHPQGNDPVLHIYSDRLTILPLKSLTISDRFIRGKIHSNDKQNIELGSLLLRQKGLMIRFNLTRTKRGSQEPTSDLRMLGECSSVGYQR